MNFSWLKQLLQLIFAMLALGLFVVVLGCSQPKDTQKISLSAAEQEDTASAHPPDQEILRFAVAAVISPKATLDTYQDLLQYLGTKLNKRVELVQGKTYAEINDLVKSGDVTVAMVCTAAYIYGNEEFGMEAVAVPVVDGKTEYYSYLIVPKGSPVRTFEQLRGKHFAFTDPLSNSGRLVPLYLLWQLGETPDTFFDKYIFTYSHDNSIKAVAQGLVDGANVDSLVYDYAASRDPRYSARTEAIWKSPPYGIPPIVVNPQLDPDFKAKLREVLLSMHEDEEGRRILRRLMFDKFIVPPEGIYDSVKEIMTKMRIEKPRKVSNPK